MRNFYLSAMHLVAALISGVCLCCVPAVAQRVQFPATADPALNGLRPVMPSQLPNTGSPTMVPINPATQAGIYPSTGVASPTFDPYAVGPGVPQFTTPLVTPTVAPPASFGSPGLGTSPLGSPAIGSPYQVSPPVYPGTPGMANPSSVPLGGYPSYGGVAPGYPGTGQSGTLGTFPNTGPGFTQPGIYPNSTPSALFPGSSVNGGTYGSTTGSLFEGLYTGIFGSPQSGYGGSWGQPVYPPVQPQGVWPGATAAGVYNPGAWNPQGTVFSGTGSYPEFIRLFQGPRFRHAYIHGDDDFDALMINDSDLALAFAIPNFFFSNQPLYLLPSFSLHQWAGLRPPATADLPPLAYSAFLDSGWQSDPARILGAELGMRVGMFSDFDTATSDSLRIQGRGIGRVRLTPRLTLKGGVVYLDRNKVKLLPAVGLLWQPNPDTRFDLFFPEPKLAHYLSTVGTADTWWYVAGYYGGGSWTVQRTAGNTDSIDINDIRLVLGLEWGRNDHMREGRRVGFFEVGYVFDRELLYKNSPLDNLDLQDTFMIRAGLGF